MRQSSKGSAPDTPVLNLDDPFRFSCHADLPCFTQCCRDVNIYLTPYDVLRLRRALNIGSEEFLAKYTRHFLAKTTHVPVVQFALDPDSLACRFVGEDGCRVYADRPWACRLYPLDLAESGPDHYRVMVNSAHCLGLMETEQRTVSQWIESQGVMPYTEMEKAYQAVMPAGFRRGQWLDPGVGKLLFLAYDLDRFEQFLDDDRIRKFYEIDDELLERVKHDDEALLHLAFRYIRIQLAQLTGLDE